MRPVEADKLRVKTVRQTNAGRDPLILDVELCPGARVYSLCLSASGSPAAAPTDWWARIVLQDSELRVYDEPDAASGADLPGLAWPAYARLEIQPDVTATLHVYYGNCR